MLRCTRAAASSSPKSQRDSRNSYRGARGAGSPPGVADVEEAVGCLLTHPDIRVVGDIFDCFPPAVYVGFRAMVKLHALKALDPEPALLTLVIPEEVGEGVKGSSDDEGHVEGGLGRVGD